MQASPPPRQGACLSRCPRRHAAAHRLEDRAAPLYRFSMAELQKWAMYACPQRRRLQATARTGPVARAARPDAGRAATCELEPPVRPAPRQLPCDGSGVRPTVCALATSCRPSRRLRQRDGLVHPASRPGTGCAREHGSRAGHTSPPKTGSGPPSTLFRTAAAAYGSRVTSINCSSGSGSNGPGWPQ